jgi:iron complex transport system substrate-binding protein
VSGLRRVLIPVSGFRSLNHSRLSAFICGCVVFASVAGAQPVSIVDDRGKNVTLAAPAQRIVALAPHLAELAFDAGAGTRLVGVARFSDFPPAARDIPQVGDAAQVDVERIVALKPDLILAWKSGNLPGAIVRLESLGYPVHASEPARLSDVPRLLRAIGALADTSASAEKAAAEFERQIAALRKRYAAARKVRVFYEIWRKPLLTVNGAHLISDVIGSCGGENVFADLRPLTPNVTLEALIAAKPDVILGGTRPGSDEAYAREWRAQAMEPLRVLPVFYVDPDLMQRPTRRILKGAEAICAHLEKVRGTADKRG